VEFRVEVEDSDKHVCEKDEVTTTNLVIEQAGSNKYQRNIIGVTNPWEVPLIRTGTEWHFVWGSVWLVPSETAESKLFIRFKGSVDDVHGNAGRLAEHNMSNYTATWIINIIHFIVLSVKL
jgi:hypothetical protein